MLSDNVINCNNKYQFKPRDTSCCWVYIFCSYSLQYGILNCTKILIFLALSIVIYINNISYISIIMVFEFRMKTDNSEYSFTCLKANIILCCYAIVVSLNRKCFRKQEGKIIIAFHNGYYDIIHSFLLFSITNK